MDADDMVETGGLMFRFVRDGDQAPFDFHTQAPELLCWFCPALSMAEAAALARMGNGMSVTAENLRRLVLDNIEAVRAAGATLPASEARSYTLRDTEPRTERVHRVAAQIVADATDLRIDALGDAPRLVERRWVDGVEHRVFVESCRTAADVTITVGWAGPADAPSGPIVSPPQPAEVAALLRSIQRKGVFFDDEIKEWVDEVCPVCHLGPGTAIEGPGVCAPDCALALMLARCEP